MRRLLLPIVASAELAALAFGWLLAIVAPRAAEDWVELCLRLFPGRDWYTGGKP